MGTRKFVGLFFLITVGVAASACAGRGGPAVLSPFLAWDGVVGGQRPGPHAGVDFRGYRWEPVLAAADGVVFHVHRIASGCGTGVVIRHAPFQRYTVYCHLEEARVGFGQEVRRGEVIGFVGTTGNSMGVPHVHHELCTRMCYGSYTAMPWHEDPLAIMAGCFDPKKTYPTDRLVLTYPVKC